MGLVEFVISEGLERLPRIFRDSWKKYPLGKRHQSTKTFVNCSKMKNATLNAFFNQVFSGDLALTCFSRLLFAPAFRRRDGVLPPLILAWL